MKVYYEPIETPSPSGNEAFDELAEKFLNAKMECFKYQTMWSLRSIEKEINIESGFIKITKEGDVEPVNFSTEITASIHRLLGQ